MIPSQRRLYWVKRKKYEHTTQVHTNIWGLGWLESSEVLPGKLFSSGHLIFSHFVSKDFPDSKLHLYFSVGINNTKPTDDLESIVKKCYV